MKAVLAIIERECQQDEMLSSSLPVVGLEIPAKKKV